MDAYQRGVKDGQESMAVHVAEAYERGLKAGRAELDEAVRRARDELAEDVTAAYYDGQVAGMEAMGY